MAAGTTEDRLLALEAELERQRASIAAQQQELAADRAALAASDEPADASALAELMTEARLRPGENCLAGSSRLVHRSGSRSCPKLRPPAR